MKQEKFNSLMVAIVAIAAVFGFTSIVWASFNQTLKIENSSATINASKWDIHFGEISALETTGTASGTRPSADAKSTTLSGFNAVLKTPGDSVSFTVKVENHEDHDDVFSRYINSYINNDEETKYFVGKAITMLTNEYGHIIYYGIKTSDAVDIYTNQGNTNGYAFFFIPDDIDSITDEQMHVINEIISSNYSSISQQEILPIKYQSIHSPEVEPIDNLINQLMNTKKRIK